MLTKVGKYYWLDVRINKKRIRRSLKTTDKSKALIAYERVYNSLLETQKDKINFSDFCKKYMDWAWSSKPASARREEQRLNKIKAFFHDQGIKYLSDITSFHIDQLRAHLKEKEISKNKTLSKTTINRYIQIIRGMFYKASAWNMYEGKNPVRNIRFYKERSPVEPLSDSQVEQIIKIAENISRWPKSAVQKEFYNICKIAINTGLRKSEILNLKWSDIKEDFFRVTGKGDQQRTVPINEKVRQILENKPRRSLYLIDIPNRNAQDPFRKSVEKIRKDTGIDWNFHQFRHYFATKLLEKGVDLVTIASILGHSKFTTSLIYSHTDKEKMRDAIEKLC